MVVTKSPQQGAQTQQVIRPGAKQVVKQPQNNTVVIKNKTATSTASTTPVGQTGQTVRKIITNQRHDSTSSETTSTNTVQGQQAMKSALTTSPRPQTVLSPAQPTVVSSNDVYQRTVPAMPIRAQMIGGKMNGGIIYYAPPSGIATGPSGGFLPSYQPIPLRTVHDNNNVNLPKFATQGNTYVQMIGNQPIVSQASQPQQHATYVPTTSQTIQIQAQSNSPDIYPIKPSILNRKRPQPSVVVQPPTAREASNPPTKQAKLETPSASSSPGLEPVSIKVATKLAHQAVIRSPQRNRRKQILDIASPLRTTNSPAGTVTSSSTVAPDKAVDDVSTDDADEWENEHPKEPLKLSFEESPTAVVHPALSRYQKFQQKCEKDNQRRPSINQPTPEPKAPEPKVARAHRTRQPGKCKTTAKKSQRAHMSWEKRDSSSLHFMCEDHANRLVGDFIDERPLRNRELKEQARCCIFKLNLLNRELSKCQNEQKSFRARFESQQAKAGVSFPYYHSQ